MKEIKFIATKKEAGSCEGYRQIKKSGDIKFDINNNSDDAIILYTNKATKIGIDCDLKTGEFRLFFSEDDIENFN